MRSDLLCWYSFIFYVLFHSCFQGISEILIHMSDSYSKDYESLIFLIIWVNCIPMRNMSDSYSEEYEKYEELIFIGTRVTHIPENTNDSYSKEYQKYEWLICLGTRLTYVPSIPSYSKYEGMWGINTEEIILKIFGSPDRTVFPKVFWVPGTLFTHVKICLKIRGLP